MGYLGKEKDSFFIYQSGIKSGRGGAVIRKKKVYCLNGASLFLRHKDPVAPLFVYSHDTGPELEAITAYHYRPGSYLSPAPSPWLSTIRAKGGNQVVP